MFYKRNPARVMETTKGKSTCGTNLQSVSVDERLGFETE